MKRIAIVLALLCGCAHFQTSKEQTKEAVSIAACVANRWGDPWLDLIAECAGPGLDLFYDIVAETEAGAVEQSDAGPKLKLLSTSQAGVVSHYAHEPAIAARLEEMRK